MDQCNEIQKSWMSMDDWLSLNFRVASHEKYKFLIHNAKTSREKPSRIDLACYRHSTNDKVLRMIVFLRITMISKGSNESHPSLPSLEQHWNPTKDLVKVVLPSSDTGRATSSIFQQIF